MNLLATLITMLTTAQVGETVSRYKRNAVLFAVAGLFFGTAYIFFLAGMAVWLSREYGTIEAMIFLALAALALGVIVIIAILIANARDRRIAMERRRRTQAQTSLAVAAGLTLFRRNPILATVLTAGAAALLGQGAGKSRRDD